MYYHRRLDHEWQTARREINYSLFGNARGQDVPAQKQNYAPETLEWTRTNRWWVKFCIANWGRKAQRTADVAWLRFKEVEDWW